MFLKNKNPILDFYQLFTQLELFFNAGHTPVMMEDIFYTYLQLGFIPRQSNSHDLMEPINGLF